MIHDPYPREIGYANRSLLVLRPRRPMIEWVQGCDPEHPASEAEIARASEAMMIPVFESPDEATGWLEENADALFEVALGAWYADPELWPERRDWAALQEWFDLELIDVLWDVVDAPLASDPSDLSGGGGLGDDPYGGFPPGGTLDGGAGEGEWN